MTRAVFHQRQRQQQGAAIVEFALVIGILLALLAGTFEFGRAFWYYEAMSKAVRDGARILSEAESATLATTGVVSARTAVINEVNNAIVPGFQPNFDESNVELKCWDSAFAELPCNNGTKPYAVSVATKSVTFTIGQYMPFVPAPFVKGRNTSTITLAPAQATMRYMREKV